MNDEVQNEVQEVEIDEVEMFGEKPVRWYQIAARNQVEQALEDGKKRILVVLPTGAGKTLTSGMIFNSARVRKALNVPADRPLRLMFIAHKHRLLSQAETTYAAAEGVQIIIQSAFSDIPQKLLDEGWDITCIDEAHHEAMMSIQYQLEKIGDMPIIGLTATPDRADGCLIKFEEIVAPISREQAVAEGYLAATQLYSFVDAPEKDKTRILKDMFDSYAEHMGQTMVFVRTKREVGIIAEYLRDLGYSAIAILSQTERELDRILNDFSQGKYQFIVNCNKINEGVDVGGCESVVLGRQFGSYPQLNQVIGRAARPDCDCRVWELINPLSGYNLDTTVIVGTPELHKLVYRKNGKWLEEEFDYTTEETTSFGVATRGGANEIIRMGAPVAA
jgi:superfamily II DNA or RNA helicase